MLTYSSLAERPQPISQAAGIPHDPVFGPTTPVWYGDALFVEVRGSRTGVDLDVVVFAKDRYGRFRSQTQLNDQMPRIATHAAAVEWVRGWLASLNDEVAA